MAGDSNCWTMGSDPQWSAARDNEWWETVTDRRRVMTGDGGWQAASERRWTAGGRLARSEGER